jgi:RNA polymerase sigma factor (sigma-70 family)
VTNQVLARARAGDEDALRELTDPYRRELQIHIYRIVGSVHDAEDLLQETLLAAWRGLEGFEGRASVRAWLYQIATNRALDALRATRRRPEDLQQMTERPEPTRYGEAIWLEPFPDVLLEGIPDQAPGPEARYETKEAIELGFIVGLQHLSPPQRAVLVLRDVLGYHAEEVAEMLDTHEYQGPATIRSFLGDRTITRGAPLLVPTRANTQPAFGVYLPPPQTEIARLYGMLVLTLEGQQHLATPGRVRRHRRPGRQR